MPVFMCRWPNGDLSFVSARSKEDAIVMLDEWDNAEVAELKQIQDFMVDFRLTDDGELELQAFGERSDEDVWSRAYPVVSEARRAALEEAGDGEIQPKGEERIRKAVEAERERPVGRAQPKLADTEIGKSLQAQTGAPAALVNRLVKHVAAETLKKAPTSGRKQ
jgi:hypothetical protein